MTKWEYLTAPILTHAAKQILDTSAHVNLKWLHCDGSNRPHCWGTVNWLGS